MSASSSFVSSLNDVLFGRYRLSNPLVFSLVTRSKNCREQESMSASATLAIHNTIDSLPLFNVVVSVAGEKGSQTYLSALQCNI